MGNASSMALDSSEVTAITTSIFSVAILIESVLAWLLIDMRKWNEFTLVIFLVSILDILTFVFEMVYRILFVKYQNPYEILSLYVFAMLPLFLLSMSVIVSLFTSYSVYHLLKHRRIFNFRSSIYTSLIFVILTIVPIVLFVGSVVFYDKYIDSFGDDSEIGYVNAFDNKNGQITFVMYELILQAYAVILILANFVLFALSFYYSNKILVPSVLKPSSPVARSESQSAIAALVSRLKYFPLIQASLFCIFYVKNGHSDIYHDSVFLNLLFIIPTLFSLVLFLKMQPNALEHLRHRLACRQRQSTVNLENTSASAHDKESLNSVLIGSDTSGTCNYKSMEHEELASMIRSDSTDSFLSLTSRKSQGDDNL